NLEPDDADACRGYVSYRTSTLKAIPGNRCGAAAITEVHGHGRRTGRVCVMEPGEVTKVGTGMQEEAILSLLTTTLYDVIVAIQDVLSPDDSTLVVATVADRLWQNSRSVPCPAVAIP